MNLTAEDKAKFKAELEEAVDRLFADEQKPEHYDGEPKSGEIFCGKMLPQVSELYPPDKYNLVFEQHRIPRHHEVYVTVKDEAVLALGKDEDYRTPFLILRAVPVEPQWKVGDYAYCTFHNAIVKITNTDNGWVYYDPFMKAMWSNCGTNTRLAKLTLRPLQDSDWTRAIAGVKVRAYEGTNGGGVLRTSGYVSPIVFAHDELPVMRELCAAKNIPIMPLALSRGKFKAPE
jgi:hypothetical protein